MPEASNYDFAVAELASDRWVITACSTEGLTTILAGVYFSKDAALGAMFETSARWLNSLVHESMAAA